MIEIIILNTLMKGVRQNITTVGLPKGSKTMKNDPKLTKIIVFGQHFLEMFIGLMEMLTYGCTLTGHTFITWLFACTSYLWAAKWVNNDEKRPKTNEKHYFWTKLMENVHRLDGNVNVWVHPNRPHLCHMVICVCLLLLGSQKSQKQRKTTQTERKSSFSAKILGKC